MLKNVRLICERIFQVLSRAGVLLLIPVAATPDEASLFFFIITSVALASFLSSFQIFYYFNRKFGCTHSIFFLKLLRGVAVALAIIFAPLFCFIILSVLFLGGYKQVSLLTLILFYFLVVLEVILIEKGRLLLNIESVSSYNWFDWGRVISSMSSLLIAFNFFNVGLNLIFLLIILAYIPFCFRDLLLLIRSDLLRRHFSKPKYLFSVVNKSKFYYFGTSTSYWKSWLDRFLPLQLFGADIMVVLSIMLVYGSSLVSVLGATLGAKLSREVLLGGLIRKQFIYTQLKIVSIYIICAVCGFFIMYMYFKLSSAVEFESVVFINLILISLSSLATILSVSLQGAVIRMDIGKKVFNIDLVAFVIYSVLWIFILDLPSFALLPLTVYSITQYCFKVNLLLRPHSVAKM